MHGRLIIGSLAVALTSVAQAEPHALPTPTDDRWHYPFNFTPGSRPVATCFGAAGSPGFNDRDAELVIGWATTGALPAGHGSGAYGVRSVKLTLVNTPNAQWPVDTTPDEWFTYDLNGDDQLNGDGIARGEPGDIDGESDDTDPGRPIELFGAGFGPFYTPSTWTETSLYVGSGSESDDPRDPFPFVFDDSTGQPLHVEDNVAGLHNAGLDVFSFTPTPWAIGEPLNYVPGNQPAPFQVAFEVDLGLSAGRVHAWFRQGLNAGRVVLVVTSLAEATLMGPQSGFPAFYTRDGVGLHALAAAPRLDIDACLAVAPDFDRDCDVDGDDVDHLRGCATGAAVTPPAGECLDADLDDDGDVDQADFGLLQRCHSGDGFDPPAGCAGP